MDLVVDGLLGLRDLESPAHVRSGKDRVTFGDPERLVRPKLICVEEMRLYVRMRVGDAQAPVPQGARGKGVHPFAAYLEVKPGIWLDEALVRGRPVEAHLSVGPDFRRVDHRVQEELELAVE